MHASSKNPVARKDHIHKTFFKKFKFIIEYAKKYNADILQAGDLFDRPRDWRMLFDIMDFFEEETPNFIYAVPGQHDSYLRTKIEENPTTLGFLSKMGHINILGKEPKIMTAPDEQSVYVYGAGWGEKIPEPEGKKNILVVHSPISKVGLFPKHKYIGMKHFINEHKEYDLILCGDIHRQFVNTKGKTILVNTGPILRRDGDKYNFKHRPSFFVWDSEYGSLEKIQIPHEPAKRVLTRVHITEADERTEENFEQFAKELLEGKHAISRIKEKIEKAMEDAGYKISKRTQKIINEALIDDET